ncbi:hypothetical protein H4R99_007544 [Coemansia sp. RSA 1722]|nr:hypothetical protein LPJ57_008289 [Coemansia sp. RSA 486]KAJ2589199.1 hypothetical protein H4R99_007544 [Coemansia sp. RSA 1722]
MDSEKGSYGSQSRSGKALEKEADTKPRDNASNADNKGMSTGSKGSGLIGRVVDSASKLAGSVARSATQGSSAFDPSLLSEQKTGVQQGSSSMSREWIAENRPGTQAAWSGQAAGTDKPSMPVGPSNAASAFRQTARMSDIHSSSLLGNTTNGHVAGQAESHQVQLAQNIDGRGVVDFLSQPMPTSMSTVIPGQGAAMSTWHPARQMRPQAANTIETTDPIAYLQGTSYAADMELADHQVPSNPQTAAANATSGNSGSLHSSPSGLIKSWNEHGASILEEWELNEAWDRAWMDTAWQTAKKPQKDSEEEPKPEPVVPTNRNLSNLLKPRI